MIRFECVECEQPLEVANDLTGRKIKCRYCDAPVMVPPRSTPWYWRPAVLIVICLALLNLQMAYFTFSLFQIRSGFQQIGIPEKLP